eukprot:Hpha_TRINITY_DN30532_c0_g1::TRINITY_DN30532_c0_g1_i1::g.193742::m.193742
MRVDPELRRRVAAGFGCLGITLVLVLAYNLGNVSEETRKERVLDNLQAVNQMARERLQMCQSRLHTKRIGKGRADMKRVRLETSLLQKENELLQQTNEYLTDTSEDCEDNLVKETGVRSESNLTHRIGRLELSNSELKNIIVHANGSKEDRRAALRLRIRAMRLENQRLRAQLKSLSQRQEQERSEREIAAEEHKRLQQMDVGLGQRSARSDGSRPLHPNKQIDGRLHQLSRSLSKGVASHAQVEAEDVEAAVLRASRTAPKPPSKGAAPPKSAATPRESKSGAGEDLRRDGKRVEKDSRGADRRTEGERKTRRTRGRDASGDEERPVEGRKGRKKRDTSEDGTRSMEGGRKRRTNREQDTSEDGDRKRRKKT